MWEQLAKVIADRVTSVVTRWDVTLPKKARARFGLKAEMLAFPIELCNVNAGKWPYACAITILFRE